MKKLLALSMSVLASAILFAGCTSNENREEETTKTETTTVTESETDMDMGMDTTVESDGIMESGMDKAESDIDKLM